MLKHPNSASGFKLNTCTHCNKTFESKQTLDDHIIKRHPDFLESVSACQHCDARFHSKTALDDHTIKKHPRFDASVTSKVHTCPTCGYRTTMKSQLARHMLKHPNAASGFKLNTCTHCNKTFESNQTLYDQIIKRHPDFLESVSGKIYECTNCEYKTTIKIRLAKHKLNHPEATGSYKRSIYIRIATPHLKVNKC
nr:unnamed protein product [Callosobruchus analis]